MHVQSVVSFGARRTIFLHETSSQYTVAIKTMANLNFNRSVLLFQQLCHNKQKN